MVIAMNIETFKLTPQRTLALTVNFAVLASMIVLSNFLVKSPPIIANEIRIAQGGLVAPVLQNNQINEKVKKISLQEQSVQFDKSVKERYPNSLIFTVAPGIKHIKLTKICQGRPVRVNVVEINPDLNPNIEVNPQLASTDKLTSKSTISSIAKRNNSIVAINGTYFKPQTGVPLGTLMINKKLYTGPIYNRVAMGFFDNGYDMARIELNAVIKTNKGEIKIDNVNQPRMLSTYTLVYTSDWGNYSPASPQYGMQIAVQNGKIIEISNQSVAIPKNGYVIVGPKSKLEKFTNAKHLNLNIKTIPNWENVNHIISGGPYLVKNNEVFIDIAEQKLLAIGSKNPRTAIGYTQDGNLILAVIDGREGASVGMTLRELANFMKSVGCVNAMNLDGGGSTVMYVNGKVVNMPKVKGGIALSNALTVNLKS